jgi:hypothetical protein
MANVSAGYNWVSGETVTPTKLNSAAAPTVVVADNEVTTAKIADGNVTTAKIADTNVTAAKLASNAVETAKIADDAVTDAKLSLAANAGEVKKALNADNAPPIFACRAWVNFDGTAGDTIGGEFRCTIRSSGNVSKVVRNSTGNYTLHFTTAMPDTSYAAVMYNNAATGTTATSFQNGLLGGMGDKTTTTMGVTSYTDTPSSGYRNSSMFDVIIFR